MWDLARANGLDVNSPYHYLVFCRDFAETSIVADGGAGPVGFVTGFRRPADPGTLFVWQVAVDHRARRQGLGLAMLAHLVARLAPAGVAHVEATVTPSNTASAALFASLARAVRAPKVDAPLFGALDFPEDHAHEPEILVRIGPAGAGGHGAGAARRAGDH